VKRALVTGATGLLGGYLVRRLAAQSWSVRALVREPRRAEPLEALGAQLVEGDIADACSIRRALAACDVVFHAAATIGSRGSWDSYRRGNVGATESILAAAAGSGSRVVLVSSTSVFGRDRYRGAPLDEQACLPQLPAWDAYGRSKQQAEAVVLAAHAAGAVWATVVRPPVMYGVGDRQFAPRLGPVLELGAFPLIGGGSARLPLVHASAVADGAFAAAVSDAAGGRVYHLTDDFDVTVADLVRHASAGLGRSVRTFRVSLATAHLASRALTAALFACGRADLARHLPGLLRMLTRENPFSSALARRELGWSPSIRPADGLREAFRWWRDRRALGAVC
jgi:nucleoside-diphosphate-sugar epimerase